MKEGEQEAGEEPSKDPILCFILCQITIQHIKRNMLKIANGVEAKWNTFVKMYKDSD